MAYATLYIGDSQTMAAEAGVLGVPFVRYNDFVGRIGYLNELENKYQLGFGIKASETGSADRLCETVEQILATPDLKKEWTSRQDKMLAEKIDYAQYRTQFIENYPERKNK
jgi:predicted glycosyltransferase